MSAEFVLEPSSTSSSSAEHSGPSHETSGPSISVIAVSHELSQVRGFGNCIPIMYDWVERPGSCLIQVFVMVTPSRSPTSGALVATGTASAMLGSYGDEAKLMKCSELLPTASALSIMTTSQIGPLNLPISFMEEIAWEAASIICSTVPIMLRPWSGLRSFELSAICVSFPVLRDMLSRRAFFRSSGYQHTASQTGEGIYKTSLNRGSVMQNRLASAGLLGLRERPGASVTRSAKGAGTAGRDASQTADDRA